MTPRARANPSPSPPAVRRGPLGRSTVLALLLMGVLAADLRAQDVPLDRAELTRYARAYLALDAAREEYYATIARIHDDIGLARARAELDAKVAEIYAGNAITSERYGVITLVISESDQVRAVFEEIVRQLRAGAGAP
ncbi:MAG: hypothetical protein FJ207_06105 [Gemmatimonadetes bacterium]|nr:hypothetical protein [Gemmatimonadota bacterium]